MSSLPTGQSSPRDLARKLHDAKVNGNEKNYLECFIDTKGKYSEMLRLSAEYNIIAYRMLKKVKSEYSNDDFERFQHFEFVDGPSFVIMLPPIEGKWIDSLEIKYEGNNRANYSDGEQIYMLIKKNNTWFIDPDLCSPPIDLKYSISLGKRSIAAIEKTLPLVGKPGVSVTDLKTEMGKITKEMRLKEKNNDGE